MLNEMPVGAGDGHDVSRGMSPGIPGSVTEPSLAAHSACSIVYGWPADRGASYVVVVGRSRTRALGTRRTKLQA